MPEDQETQHWFILLNGKRYGPYTLPALVKGVEKGVIGKGAGVWRPGWEQWRTAADIAELFAPEPPPIEEFEPREQLQERAEAPGTSLDEREEAPQEKRETEHAEPVNAEAEDRTAAGDHAAAEDAVGAGSGAVSIEAAPVSTVPEPAVADLELAKAQAVEADTKEADTPEADTIEADAASPREVRESARRNRFRDGPDLFGRGFARSDPVRLEPIKSDTAKVERPRPDRVRPEVGKLDLGKLDLAKLDLAETPRREGREPGSRDLLARAIPSELGAPDIGSRNPPLTDAALRVRLNTMLASAELPAPGKDDTEEAGAADDADAKKAVEPADPVGAKPPIAVERLSDVAGAARSRKADVKADIATERGPPKLSIAAEREVPKFKAGAPPIAAPLPVPELEDEPESARRGGLLPVILSVLATLIVVCALAWAASALGLIRVEFLPGESVLRRSAAALQSLPSGLSAVHPHATLDGLPDIVANMPAVIALKMADPDAYGKFVKRFNAVYRDNEPDDVILTQARTALRKSIKHMLANATNESLLEVTEVNLTYMRALAQSNAGSCVALSDESKGAVLDSNLARDFPPLFEREMAVLERVIANAGAKQTAPSEAEVRPYLEAVFAGLKKKPVQMQMLGRDKLTEAEYAPYCDLVIAFYEGVRGLPYGDAVKLLRNLYAAAAADPDKT
jgi:GYF domain 2